MSKKTIWLAVILAVIVVSLGGYFYFQKWWGVKQQKIEQGLASDKFPWRDYTPEELSKMYPQIKYADVPTRVTPEETYGKFRETLRTNNLEMALEQLAREGKRYAENVDKLRKAHKENNFLKSIELYPEKTWRSTFGESIGNLCYEQMLNNEKIVACSSFIKDANGDWKMDSL